MKKVSEELTREGGGEYSSQKGQPVQWSCSGQVPGIVKQHRSYCGYRRVDKEMDREETGFKSCRDCWALQGHVHTKWLAQLGLRRFCEVEGDSKDDPEHGAADGANVDGDDDRDVTRWGTPHSSNSIQASTDTLSPFGAALRISKLTQAICTLNPC